MKSVCKIKRQKDAGVTLVELMVTMVIASMVATSTFMFFAGQKKVYESQTRILNLQQNLWAAMETVTRNLRAAGTGMVGCVRPDPDGPGGVAGDPPPASITPPATGLRVELPYLVVPAPYPASPLLTRRLAPLWIENGINGAPDSFVVVFGDGTSGNFVDTQLAADVSDHASNITTPIGGTAVFRVNEFILLVNNTATPLNQERGCTVYQITGIDVGNNRLLHNTAQPWNPKTADPNLYPLINGAGNPSYRSTDSGIRNFGQLRWIRFAIDATGPVPNLTMHRLDNTAATPQILAEGIEDLQIAYACDSLPAGAPDGELSEGADAAARTADEWILNTAGDPIPAECIRPQAIRVNLIARSAYPDDTLEALDNRKPALEDGVQGPDDNFRHRVLQTTVFPRN